MNTQSTLSVSPPDADALCEALRAALELGGDAASPRLSVHSVPFSAFSDPRVRGLRVLGLDDGRMILTAVLDVYGATVDLFSLDLPELRLSHPEWRDAPRTELDS